MQQYLEKQGDWDKKEDQVRINNLREDIEAATIQLQLMEKQKRDLDEESKDLEFRLCECQVELETQQQSEGQQQNEPQNSEKIIENEEEKKPKRAGTFFTIYESLETELNEEQGKFDASNSLRSELKHRYNKLKKLGEQSAKSKSIEESRYNEEAPIVEDLNNIRSDISSQIEQKKEELVHVTEIFEDTNRKLEELSAEIKDLEENGGRMLQDKKRIAKELEEFTKTEKKQKIILQKKNEELLELTRDKSSISIGSPRSWQATRNSLIASIKKYRQQIASEQAHAEGNEKAIKDIKAKLGEIVGSTDPNCTRARAICLKEIEELNAPLSEDELSDLKAEEYYLEDLKKQVNSLSNSIKVFDGFRKQQMSQLNTEYETSSDKGYIGLLQSELAELQAQLAKL